MKLYLYRTGQGIVIDTSQGRSGAEGTVYPLRKIRGVVAKVYHAPTRQHERKLRAMLATPPVDPEAARGGRSIAWPTDLLLDTKGTTVGFVMPEVKGKEVQYLLRPKKRREAFPAFTYEAALIAAHNFAAAYEALHAQGHAVCDTNPLNSLVRPDARVALVDCDSMQVADPSSSAVYRCPVGIVEYTPPEYQGLRYDAYTSGPGHDRFGLAVLLFMLLMEGTHPFAARVRHGATADPSTDSLQGRIQNGRFPYLKSTCGPYLPRPSSPPFTLLSPTIRRLFSTCFVDGHRDPLRRPGATAWRLALGDEIIALVRCSRNDFHVYPSHHARCPWCALKKRVSYDPFPRPGFFARPGSAQASTPSFSPTSTSPPANRPGAGAPVATAPPPSRITVPTRLAPVARTAPSRRTRAPQRVPPPRRV